MHCTNNNIVPHIWSLCVLGTVSSPVDETEKGGPVYSRCVHVHVKDPVKTERMLPVQN